MTKQRIEHRIARIKVKLKVYDDRCGDQLESEYYSFHGGRSIGYLEGQLSILEDLLDYMD